MGEERLRPDLMIHFSQSLSIELLSCSWCPSCAVSSQIVFWRSASIFPHLTHCPFVVIEKLALWSCVDVSASPHSDCCWIRDSVPAGIFTTFSWWLMNERVLFQSQWIGTLAYASPLLTSTFPDDDLRAGYRNFSVHVERLIEIMRDKFGISQA